ncbi:threonine aldolase 1 [Salmo trutta]|uniref:threonine aldolase 1 n=1 Tax=Salmo trutta TaxID=8032 RepID=UPI001130A8D7|nr:uncharacterized protein LOC115200856 [Salmo trutta]
MVTPTPTQVWCVCVNTQHTVQGGGRVLPLPFLQEVKVLADRYGLAVHIDGARMMNAAIAQKDAPSTILQNTHRQHLSVQDTVCVLQGLGAPEGTMLAAPQDYISRAVRCCKSIGRGLCHAGILSAAGIGGHGQHAGDRVAPGHLPGGHPADPPKAAALS